MKKFIMYLSLIIFFLIFWPFYLIGLPFALADWLSNKKDGGYGL